MLPSVFVVISKSPVLPCFPVSRLTRHSTGRAKSGAPVNSGVRAQQEGSVRLLRFTVFALSLLLPAISIAQVTVEEARTLPLKQLATKLLGDSGRIMIDVDRPRFPNVMEQVTFYSHATVTGSQLGLCGADWVTVDFDERGLVDTLRAQRRYGVAGNTHPKTTDWTYDESGEICAAVTSTRDYFPAPDPQSALEVSWYVEALAGQGPFPNQDFEYSCTGWCENNKGELHWLKLKDIYEIQEIDCPASDFKYPSCFQVTVGENRVGPFPKTFKIYGVAHLDKVVVTKVTVDVGSTLE